MSDIVERDFISYAEDLLPSQFQNATNTRALLEIFLSEDQVFQDELKKLFDQGLDIDTATGYQLEIIGKLSGVERTNIDDDIYRDDIKFQRTVDNSSGTRQEIVDFLKNISGVDDVLLIDNYPAAFITQIQGGETVTKDIADRVDGVAGAGINAHSVIHLEQGYGIVPVESDQYQDNLDTGTGEYVLIPEGDDNWRSILPEIADVYDIAPTSAGEAVMQAGEAEALAGGYTPKDEFTTRGRVSETYTNKNYI